jgi:penicillin-binding protein 2
VVTPLQVANEMAYLANKGWYKTPHMVDSIEGGDSFDMLTKFTKMHKAVNIPDSIFEAVHGGMQGVMETGTGSAAKVPGIAICGKTGTVENYYRGVKEKSHAFFAAFAPRENPKIAIAVICENAGFGASSAAPIASLMIEKYLKDSITDPKRKAKVEALSKLNLMPARIYKEVRYRDSLAHAKDSAYLLAKGYIKIIKDTLGMDDEDDAEAIEKLKQARQKDTVKKSLPSNKDTGQTVPAKTEAVLPREKKMTVIKDSAK